MKMEDFTLWLYGYLYDKNRSLTSEETKLIEEKLNSCFNKVTPITLNFNPHLTKPIGETDIRIC